MNQPESQVAEKPPIILNLISKARASKPITLAVLAGVILLLGVAWYWYDKQPIISSELIAKADFAIYAPKRPPAGYTIDNDQTGLKAGVLTYKFNDQAADNDIAITVQDKPQGFDMGLLGMDGTISNTSTTNGVLYNLSAGDSTQYLLDTGDTLVYITSPDNLDLGMVTSIANSLTRYR